ncbi:MAG: hypothetical protein LBI53_05875 [Candidatus Peribacteria bacterium]|nr:hypothetical protein [Candidatus Peribacteria bacterium]
MYSLRRNINQNDTIMNFLSLLSEMLGIIGVLILVIPFVAKPDKKIKRTFIIAGIIILVLAIIIWYLPYSHDPLILPR